MTIQEKFDKICKALYTKNIYCWNNELNKLCYSPYLYRDLICLWDNKSKKLSIKDKDIIEFIFNLLTTTNQNSI